MTDPSQAPAPLPPKPPGKIPADLGPLARSGEVPPKKPGSGQLRIERLRQLLARTQDGGAGKGTEELPALYRFASTELARLESSGHDQGRLQDVRRLVAGAHQVVYSGARDRETSLLRRMLHHFFVESPHAIWSEWKLALGLTLVFYGLAGAAFLGVRHDLELAYALQPAEMVDVEIEQLRGLEAGEDFRGNFTFGMEQSGSASGMILANNIFVTLLFFASGLIPPLFLLVLTNNTLMLGTYLGVPSHWNQTMEISSILWCHGTIELQMIILGGVAGLVLARAYIAPGPWSRAHAMFLESRRAWAIVSPTIVWLFFSGLIEGYVTPHAPLSARIGTAVATGFLLAAWLLYGEQAHRSRQPAKA